MPRLLSLLLFALPAIVLPFFAGAEAHHVYYVDCGSTTAGSGDSPASPWNDLRAVNAQSYSPGDTIRLQRGTECHGTLAPHGSGAPDHPIRLSAYGEGNRPRIIAAPAAEAVLRLFNQQYWEIDSLDLSGARTFGVFISGDAGILHHIHLTNLAIHDVLGEEIKHKESGLLVITPGTAAQHFDDVLIDGVTAWNTQQWAGILVGGGNFGFPSPETWNTNVIIRNSTVHDVQGDGIVLFRVRNGLIETSVAWNTGMQITQSIGTPNAIWTWMCDQCTVAYSEAFLTDSPGVDGGAFDIDYGNTGNNVIENYGHDTQGYCVAVFGAGFVTRKSTVSGNLCINNGRSPRMANFQGAIFLHTWNGGSIEDLTVEKNTVYWSPYEGAPAVINDAETHGDVLIFRDNNMNSTSPWLIDSKTALVASHNQYRCFGTALPEWRFGAQIFAELSDAQKAGQETGSRLSSHKLAEWGQSNVAQDTLAHFDADSAFGGNWISLAGTPHAWSGSHHWHLYAELPGVVGADDVAGKESMRQLVILRSLAAQYRGDGLEVTLLFATPSHGLSDLIRDMQLDAMDIAIAGPGVGAQSLKTVLVTPGGRIADEWRGFAGPAALGFVTRQCLGEPIFSQMGVSR